MWTVDGQQATCQVTFDDAAHGPVLQFCLIRLRGGPMGGICCVARARKASAMR